MAQQNQDQQRHNQGQTGKTGGAAQFDKNDQGMQKRAGRDSTNPSETQRSDKNQTGSQSNRKGADVDSDEDVQR